MTRLFRFDPNFLSLISGILLSVGTSVLTGVLAADVWPARTAMLLCSSAFALASAVCWAVLAWKLASVERLTLLDAPKGVDREKAWAALVDKRRVGLSLLSLGALVLALAAIGTLIPR